jgi:hypothetical protein
MLKPSSLTQKQFVYLPSDYLKVQTLPRGSARHKYLIGLLSRIQLLAESGDIVGAQTELDRAEKTGKFNVSYHLPAKIREEKERANNIFQESAKQTILYWSMHRRVSS